MLVRSGQDLGRSWQDIQDVERLDVTNFQFQGLHGIKQVSSSSKHSMKSVDHVTPRLL